MIETKEDVLLTESEVAIAKQRRLEAMALQQIEGNALSPDQVALFEMFEREHWSHERRRAFLRARARKANLGR